MKNVLKASPVLSQYFALSYVIVLINASVFLRQIDYSDFMTCLFAGAIYLTYCYFYILPVFLLFVLLQKILNIKYLPGFVKSDWLICGLAVIVVTVVQMLIYTDSFVFKIFGFHFNSFVWNLVTTKGGIESMGSSPSAVRSFIATLLFFFAVQAGILLSLMLIPQVKNFCRNFLTRCKLTAATVVIIIVAVLQGLAYGLSSFYDYKPVVSASEAFPFYVPVRFSHMAKSLGLKAPVESSFNMKFGKIKLQYPLNPIKLRSDGKNYNIIFLMAESLRADMLDAEIMPKTWEFSQQSVNFKQHYSGGNGTRMAMFAAFYGLYGNYWFKFLNEHKGPVIIDLLQANNYQMTMFSSAKFSYPEFDNTIFVKLPREKLFDSGNLKPGIMGWEYDRQNVSHMLDFIENHDKSRPFMTFMFFESPHALYYFPPENIIRTSYLGEFNYAKVDLKNDIGLIKNRYINSCNHLDSQFDRIFKYLKEKSLLDSTIVIITGDHGEEFMEKGRWGHNSDYSEEQTLVPMVLWVPGVKPRQVESMTSHLDIPATILNILGVANPPDDYSFGIDMLGKDKRQFSIISGWDTIAYVDSEYKAIFPLEVFGKQKMVMTKADDKITSEGIFYQTHLSQLNQIMKGLSRFSK